MKMNQEWCGFIFFDIIKNNLRRVIMFGENIKELRK